MTTTRKSFQALNPLRAFGTAARVAARKGRIQEPRFAAVYPTVPAMWPSRSIRRAVKQGRDDLLPRHWWEVLKGPNAVPGLLAAVRGL